MLKGAISSDLKPDFFLDKRTCITTNKLYPLDFSVSIPTALALRCILCQGNVTLLQVKHPSQQKASGSVGKSEKSLCEVAGAFTPVAAMHAGHLHCLGASAGCTCCQVSGESIPQYTAKHLLQ